MNTLTFEQIPNFLLLLGEKVSSIEERLNASVNPNNVDRPLHTEEAAAFLNLEIPTLYTLVQKRKVPHHRQGKKLYFFKSELVDWIKSGKQHNTIAQKVESTFIAANKKRGGIR